MPSASWSQRLQHLDCMIFNFIFKYWHIYTCNNLGLIAGCGTKTSGIQAVSMGIQSCPVPQPTRRSIEHRELPASSDYNMNYVMMLVSDFHHWPGSASSITGLSMVLKPQQKLMCVFVLLFQCSEKKPLSTDGSHDVESVQAFHTASVFSVIIMPLPPLDGCIMHWWPFSVCLSVCPMSDPKWRMEGHRKLNIL